MNTSARHEHLAVHTHQENDGGFMDLALIYQ